VWVRVEKRGETLCFGFIREESLGKGYWIGRGTPELGPASLKRLLAVRGLKRGGGEGKPLKPASLAGEGRKLQRNNSQKQVGHACPSCGAVFSVGGPRIPLEREGGRKSKQEKKGEKNFEKLRIPRRSIALTIRVGERLKETLNAAEQPGSSRIENVGVEWVSSGFPP